MAYETPRAWYAQKKVVGLLAIGALVACHEATTAPDGVEPPPPVFGFGNGAPSGSHYDLNIIGVSHTKTANMNGGGNVIFVGLGSDDVHSITTINLCESGKGAACATLDPSTFMVLDKNGTDGTASFALPNPAPNFDPTVPNSDVPAVYSVYARPLGKPGGIANNTTCGTVLDPLTGGLDTLCSMVRMRIDRYKGKQSFIDATRCLLYIYAALPGTTTITRLPIFADTLVNSWWQYDNQGLKLAQVRFYPVPDTNVPDPSVVTDCTNLKNK